MQSIKVKVTDEYGVVQVIDLDRMQDEIARLRKYRYHARLELKRLHKAHRLLVLEHRALQAKGQEAVTRPLTLVKYPMLPRAEFVDWRGRITDRFGL